MSEDESGRVLGRSGDHTDALGIQDTPQGGQRMVPHVVENQVVSLPALGEILLGVIDDAIRAEGLHHVHILRAADAGHLRAERLGDLHSERAHTSPCTVNQHPVPRLNSLSRRPCKAVSAATGTEAASPNVSFSGFPINADSEAHAYSARARRHVPKTGSPGLNRVTFLPTTSTWPATS